MHLDLFIDSASGRGSVIVPQPTRHHTLRGLWQACNLTFLLFYTPSLPDGNFFGYITTKRERERIWGIHKRCIAAVARSTLESA